MKLVRLAVLVALTGCSPDAPPAPEAGTNQMEIVTIPGPDAQVAAGSLPTPELDGVATTPGRWRRDRGAGGGAGGDAVIFADRGGRTLFGMRCARAKQRWLFVRAGAVGGGAGSMKIVTASGAASYPVLPRAFAPGVIAAAAIDDPFIATSLAQATGRIGVMLSGGAVLAMPAEAVIGDVVRDCVANRRAQSS